MRVRRAAHESVQTRSSVLDHGARRRRGCAVLGEADDSEIRCSALGVLRSRSEAFRDQAARLAAFIDGCGTKLSVHLDIKRDMDSESSYEYDIGDYV
jgi:hypothetical protein